MQKLYRLYNRKFSCASFHSSLWWAYFVEDFSGKKVLRESPLISFCFGAVIFCIKSIWQHVVNRLKWLKKCCRNFSSSLRIVSDSSVFQQSFKLIFMYPLCWILHYKAGKVSLMIKVTIKTWELLLNCTVQVICSLIELKKVTTFLYLSRSFTDILLE